MPNRSPRDVPAGTPRDPEASSEAAPTIPSFDSLRARRRRSPVDVLMPETPPAPRPETPPAPHATRPAPPRPPDYADLLRLGVHVVRTLAGVPMRCVRRLLGG